MQNLRTHNSHATASKIVELYTRDITRLEALKAQGKLNKAESQELERIQKAKALVIRASSVLNANRDFIGL